MSNTGNSSRRGVHIELGPVVDEALDARLGCAALERVQVVDESESGIVPHQNCSNGMDISIGQRMQGVSIIRFAG